jgi:peptidyl-dipeptidase Dcp
MLNKSLNCETPDDSTLLSRPAGRLYRRKKENPFFSRFDTPFGVPPFDKIKNEHFLPAIQEGIKQHAKEIEKIASLPEAPTFENTILALDRSGEMLERVTPIFFNIYSANTNEELQKINQE